MSETATGMTWEEFLALPDAPEYRHAELIDGVIVLNPPTRLHQRVVARLVAALDAWTREEVDRGEATMDPAVQISVRRGYLPDVAWFPEERCGPRDDTEAAFSGPPALVVEVLSPSTRAFDALRKRVDYARVGVDELWLVDPEEPAAQVYRRPASPGEVVGLELVEELGADGALRSPLLPGFAVVLGALLRR